MPTLVSSFDDPQNISKFVTFLRVLFSPLIPEEYCIAATLQVTLYVILLLSNQSYEYHLRLEMCSQLSQSSWLGSTNGSIVWYLW